MPYLLPIQLQLQSVETVCVVDVRDNTPSDAMGYELLQLETQHHSSGTPSVLFLVNHYDTSFLQFYVLFHANHLVFNFNCVITTQGRRAVPQFMKKCLLLLVWNKLLTLLIAS